MDIKELKLKAEQKVKSAAKNSVDAVKNAARWMHENPEITVTIATLGTYILREGFKRRSYRAFEKERRFKETHSWDASTGSWVRHKRLTRTDIVRLNRLRSEGYSVTESLYILRLI